MPLFLTLCNLFSLTCSYTVSQFRVDVLSMLLTDFILNFCSVWEVTLPILTFNAGELAFRTQPILWRRTRASSLVVAGVRPIVQRRSPDYGIVVAFPVCGFFYSRWACEVLARWLCLAVVTSIATTGLLTVFLLLVFFLARPGLSVRQRKNDLPQVGMKDAILTKGHSQALCLLLKQSWKLG